MKKQDDAATITTAAATAVTSQRFRGLTNLTKIEWSKTFFLRN
jgi:hypothetical protein